MNMDEIYSSGNYYKEVYLKNVMDLKTCTKWMRRYYNIIKRIFPQSHSYKEKKILEIGSSFGGFINILNSEGFINVTASDLSDMIFPKELKNTLFRTDLLQKNENPDNKYDLIFAFDVLEHIANSQKVIENLKTYLNGKGIFIFSVPYPNKKHLIDKYHINMQYPNFYTNLFYQNGFELISMLLVSFVPFIWRIGLPFYIKRIIENRYFISELFFVFRVSI